MQDIDAVFEAEFEERLHEVVSAAHFAMPVRPNLHRATVSCRIIGQKGDTLWVDQNFTKWVGDDVVELEICEKVQADGKPRVVLVEDSEQRPLLLTYAPGHIAKNWPIRFPDASENALETWSVVVGAVTFAHLSDELDFAARALGLSNLEARVCAALVVHGSVRSAAQHAGVTYQTARKAVAEAMTHLKVSRQTTLVRKLSELATQSAPPRESIEALLVDIFQLRAKDAKLALLLCEGHTRDAAAQIAGLSKSAAKDRFKRIFQDLGIGSATEIPRLIMEAFAAAMLIKPEPPVSYPAPHVRTPLRLIQRGDGSVIAVSDYGPKDAKPILILHSSLSTRHPFLKVVHALQDAGFRPLTIDRPGFGLSDDIEIADGGHDVDPFCVGAADVALVCKTLEISSLTLLTRGGSFAALALARAYPELVEKAVLINPDMLHQQCSQRKGNLGIVRTAFDKYPGSIEAVVRWSAAQLSPRRAQTFIHMAMKDCPIDIKSFQDPSALEDYKRSIMGLASGKLAGFLREQRGYVSLPDVQGLHSAPNWTLVQGDDDPVHDMAEAITYWKGKLPGAKVVRVQGANRFISLSHTDQIISVLQQP